MKIIYYHEIKKIKELLVLGKTWKQITEIVKCSMSTISKVVKNEITITDEFSESYKAIDSSFLVDIIMKKLSELKEIALNIREKKKIGIEINEDLDKLLFKLF